MYVVMKEVKGKRCPLEELFYIVPRLAHPAFNVRGAWVQAEWKCRKKAAENVS
jgi:hypothetical protein